ncbi:glycoside hydrolase family 25 protein [Rhizobiaceae bacterium]|nr:glycoside hydrolase family 25 protein [Rhizobiaceae bacterium]
MLAVFATLTALATTSATAGEFNRPWKDAEHSIVLDAYEFTPIEWPELAKNKNLVGFINKASDGMPPKYCGKKGDKFCRVMWRRYAATKELYHTRKFLAKAMGYKWGAYHLARPGNPIAQAQHFLQFAKPGPDDLIALDIEDNMPGKWMSLKDAERFASYIKRRTGRYPVLYTNHSTAKHIAHQRDKYKILSKLNLWYARYKEDTRGAFPMGNWKSYSMWQFSSMVNCSKRRCPKRIAGTGPWIDVNVAAMPPKELHAKWPFAELPEPYVAPKPKPPKVEAPLLVAGKNAPVAASGSAFRSMVEAAKSTVVSRSASDAARRMRVALDETPHPSFRPGTELVQVASLEKRTTTYILPIFETRPVASIRSSDDARDRMMAKLSVAPESAAQGRRHAVLSTWPVKGNQTDAVTYRTARAN